MSALTFAVMFIVIVVFYLRLRRGVLISLVTCLTMLV